MHEDAEQPFTFTGRWRGRRLWILVCTSLLAAALVVLLLAWVVPSSENGRERAALAGQEAEQTSMEEEAPGGQPPETPAQTGGESPTMIPGTGGQAHAIVVDFPDPAGAAPETPPPGGYEDVYGRWVLDMSGSAYGLTNCHIILEENGTISSPPDYAQVFEVVASSYAWKDGNPSFTATLQLILKMGGAGGVAIPVQIEFSGTVSGPLTEMSGDFTATPQGEAYAPYAQQGTFRMRR